MSGATPRKSKQSVDISDLYSRRESLVRIIGGIPECPLDYFVDNLLPPLPDDASTVLAEVKSQLGIISGWAAKYEFPEPGKPKLSEDKTFATLCRVFNDVNKACHDKSTKPMILKMVDTPNRAPSSDEESEPAHSTSLDSCFVLRETKGAPQPKRDGVAWCDVAVAWEYKNGGTMAGRRENARKILWSMSQILALDPYRRFTFGLTVENDGIRIWFCDRSAYMVSDILPYLDCDIIINVFVRFASASEERLGYDPSITRVLDYRQTVQYDIQMPAKDGLRVFRTKRILANHSADRATGRGTRVWEVYDRDGKDVHKTHALKDAWVETSRPREAETHRAVLAGASEEEKKYFLTVLSDGDVKLAPGVADTTLGTRNGSPPTAFKVFMNLVRDYTLYTITRPQWNTSTSQGPQDPKTVRALVNRAHYRVLFAEVGIPISQLRDMEMIWRAVCHANKGLIIMLKTQHIHRDISAGNILMCGGQGKITDLEFSARFDSETDGSGIHASLAGTADFMSAELFQQRYLHIPTRRPIRINHQTVISVHRFFQNYLHDAESLWWVVLWCLARLDPQGRHLAKDEEALGRRRALYMQWFPREDRKPGNAFDQPLKATTQPDSLMNLELPEVYRPIQLILDEWRVAIAMRIFKMQASQLGKVDFEGIQDVHFDVDAVVNSKESLNIVQQVGVLELIEGLL